MALDSATSPQQLGAYIAAAKKAYKAQICIDAMLEKTEVDWTPTLAVHVVSGIMGRAISRKLLLGIFATEGRTASDKSVDFQFVEMIIEDIKPRTTARLEAAEQDMSNIISALKDAQASRPFL